MCGINGCVPPSQKISLMNEQISHRGPDGFGEFHDKNISLGHVRLSILDLSDAAAQPMGLFDDGLISATRLETANYVLVFNGEIYNFKELKEELKIDNSSTSGDSEVILHAYKKWGSKCVEKFNGMWAFCIYDKEKKELFLSRDRLGQKPLYYYYDGSTFAFSSELKGLRALYSNLKLDKESVDLYFSLGFVPSPRSIYASVFKLEQGHSLLFSLKNNSLKKLKYYSLPALNVKKRSFPQLKKKYFEIMSSAVNYRLIADVPVGAFLSGGIDSSSVVAFIKQKRSLDTFSIGFKGEKYDETPYINQVKDFFKTNHHHTYYTKKHFLSDIDQYSLMYDEPFGDYSGFPAYFVSKMASKEVTVVLSGDGGDEIFGGYPTHMLGKRMELLRKVPFFIRNLISKIPIRARVNSASSLSLLTHACKLSLLPKERFFSDSLKEDLFKPGVFQDWSSKNLKHCLDLSQNDLSEALRVYDLLYNTLSDNYLTKVDRASMYCGIEVRSPYLDHRFIEFSQELLPSHKANIFSGKRVLKKFLKDMLPGSIITRKKQGFTPPLEDWIFDDDLQEYLVSVLDKLKSITPQAHTFFKEKVFQRKDRPYKIYLIRLFLFGKWLDTWMPEVK